MALEAILQLHREKYWNLANQSQKPAIGLFKAIQRTQDFIKLSHAIYFVDGQADPPGV
jgi:predicted GTPase